MFQLIESIRIENKELHHLELHNNRFNTAAKELFKVNENFNLKNYISIPKTISKSRHKCRICFDGTSFTYENTPYTQRSVKSIKLVEFNQADYTYKTTNREQLDSAYNLRGNCDDIIIVKNNHLTDSWAANIILFDGSDWYTPDTPLLEGIQRQYLLDSGIIKCKQISVNDLPNFTSLKLINAMVDFERADIVEIRNIFPQ